MSAAVGQARGPVGRRQARPWRRVPLPPLIALGLCGMVGVVASMPTAPTPAAHVLAARTISIKTAADESSIVRDVTTGAVVGHVPATGPSFARGLFHNMRYFRRLHSAPQDAPYRLSELSDGRVVLWDPTTRTALDLESFGAGNASAFTAWLGMPPIASPR
jgi:putative photosynthetic complex assembly protein